MSAEPVEPLDVALLVPGDGPDVTLDSTDDEVAERVPPLEEDANDPVDSPADDAELPRTLPSDGADPEQAQVIDATGNQKRSESFTGDSCRSVLEDSRCDPAPRPGGQPSTCATSRVRSDRA